MIQHLGTNLHIVDSGFKKEAFIKDDLQGVEYLGLKERNQHIADSMRNYLPEVYSKAIEQLPQVQLRVDMVSSMSAIQISITMVMDSPLWKIAMTSMQQSIP